MKGKRWSYEGKDWEVSRELNIRHLKYEEAERKTLRWLDDLYSSGKGCGIVIHGRNSEVLKPMVIKILKKDKRVKNESIKRHKDDSTRIINPGAVSFSFF